MPHIGSDAVDGKGLELIREWIMALPPRAGGAPPSELTVQATSERAASTQLIESPSTPAGDASNAVDRLLASTAGALSLVCEVQNGKLPAAICSVAKDKGIASSQEYVRDLFRRFDPAEQQRNHLGSSINAAHLLALRGDSTRGRDVFFGAANAGLCADVIASIRSRRISDLIYLTLPVNTTGPIFSTTFYTRAKRSRPSTSPTWPEPSPAIHSPASS